MCQSLFKRVRTFDRKVIVIYYSIQNDIHGIVMRQINEQRLIKVSGERIMLT